MADRAPAGIEAVAQVPMTLLSSPYYSCCYYCCPVEGEVFAFAALYATAAHFYYLCCNHDKVLLSQLLHSTQLG